MQILKNREKLSGIEYDYVFILPSKKEVIFPCDYDGNIFFDQLSREDLKIYHSLSDGKLQYIESFIEEVEIMDIVSHAVGKCDCGQEIILFSFVNRCPSCHKEYSITGEELPAL